jgi:hypothetical protein
MIVFLETGKEKRKGKNTGSDIDEGNKSAYCTT